MVTPRSLSPTSLDKYEKCPARWKAETFNYGSSPDSAAALKGTVVHAVLERWVADGHYQRRVDLDEATRLYDHEYHNRFSDDSEYADGLQMVLGWVQRQDWSDRRVLSTEVKQFFTINTSAGPLKINYIFDRCDELDDGEIEVVDYKTFIMPMAPADMRGKVQPRMYGLAAQMMYPKAERIWVTFDLLRYGPVGIAFTKEQNRETHKYLKEAAERIIADPCTKETLNTECKWCVRKHQCKALKSHLNAGGALSITDVDKAVKDRKELGIAIQAAKVMQDDLDAFIFAHMENEGVTEVGGIKAAVRNTRSIDPLTLRRIIGPELALGMAGDVGIGAVDKLLRTDQIDPDQKAAIKAAIRKQPSKPFLKVD